MSRPLVFMGSKNAGLLLCKLIYNALPTGSLKAILCPNDQADARSVLAEFRQFGTEASLPLHVIESRDEVHRHLEHYGVEMAIVHGWYQIIPIDDRCSFYGFHYSALPKYRGNAPLVWQLINGESEIGVSFFKLSEGIDDGKLVAQRVVAIQENDSIGDALELANQVMLELADQYIPVLVTGKEELFPQPDIEPSYCGLRTPDDGQIDWSWPAARVHNFVRAQSSPYPGAFTFTADQKLVRIWQSSVDPRVFYGMAGSVAEVTQEWVVVCCGEGAIRVYLAEFDSDGKRPAQEILRSVKIRFTSPETRSLRE